MKMPSLSAVFAYALVAALLAGTVLRLWLSGRQIQAVKANRDRVPAAFADRIAAADHQKAADYTVATVRLGRRSVILDTLVTLGLTVAGAIGAIDLLWQRSGWASPWRGAMVIFTVVCLTALIDLPFSIWRTFGIEARFGFNRTTPKLFIADLAKGCLIGLVLGGPIVLAALTLMDRAGQLWWLWA